MNDDVDVHGEVLHAVEGGDEREGDPALRVHVLSQEEVLLQVLFAEVVLPANTH
jgi:hypothetical protein